MFFTMCCVYILIMNSLYCHNLHVFVKIYNYVRLTCKKIKGNLLTYLPTKDGFIMSPSPRINLRPRTETILINIYTGTLTNSGATNRKHNRFIYAVKFNPVRRALVGLIRGRSHSNRGVISIMWLGVWSGGSVKRGPKDRKRRWASWRGAASPLPVC